MQVTLHQRKSYHEDKKVGAEHIYDVKYMNNEQYTWKIKTAAHSVLVHYMPQPPAINNMANNCEEVQSLDDLYDIF